MVPQRKASMKKRKRALVETKTIVSQSEFGIYGMTRWIT